jgi:circadian clock protein KaiB
MTKQTAIKQAPRYKFSVYIASPTIESETALARLRKICDEQIPLEYEIEVFDLSKNARLASDLNIVATPAIFRTLPAPVLKSIGDLPEQTKHY